MSTPLYDALIRFAQEKPLRMHMPGHKGNCVPMAEFAALAPLDWTELPPTGNLFQGGGPIQAAQELWARAFRMDGCLFLTGGSTQGLHTALALTCGPGDRILVDRGCHRSVYHAMALLDLEPVYLNRRWLDGAGVPGPLDAGEADRMLTEHPEIQTVCITSPTYYGVLTDIPALAEVCHRHGARLVVDGAHGAHLPFLGDWGMSRADVVVVSAHKTLPAPGQTALLFVNGMDMDRVRSTASVFGSSSPSYPMMAALDCVRDWLEGEGGAAYRRSAEHTRLLRQRFPSIRTDDAPLDPTRFVLCCDRGYDVEKDLQELGVWPEMADMGHVVCILTCADGETEVSALTAALDRLGFAGGERPERAIVPPPMAERVTSLRASLFARAERVSLEQALGRVAAQSIAPYPPGIPVIAPGELVDKKLLSYLNDMGYNEKDVAIMR